MRHFPPILCVVALLAGCAGGPGRKAPGEGAAALAEVTPVQFISGKVVLVREQLRYVVVDFGVSLQPKPGDRLGVYRDGNRVGEVRISQQASAGNVAADIMAGEARVGDEVRSR